MAGVVFCLAAAFVAIRHWSATSALATARLQRSAGNLDAAATSYREALSKGSAEAAVELAWLTLLRKRWQEAAVLAREAMVLQPANGYPRLLAAEAEAGAPGPWNRERRERVAVLCQQAVELAPTTPEIWARCGSLLLVRNRADIAAGRDRADRSTVEAAIYFDQALRLRPRDVRDHLAAALEASGEAGFVLEIAAGSGSDKALAELVDLLLRAGLWELIEPAYWARASTDGAEASFARAAAQSLRRAGKRRAAFEALHWGTVAASQDAELAFLTAEAALRMPGGGLEAAWPHFASAIRLDPGKLQYRLGYARSLLAAGELAAAEEASRAACGIDDESAEAWFLLGESKRRSGSAQAAGPAYRRAAELAPRNLAYRKAAAGR